MTEEKSGKMGEQGQPGASERASETSRPRKAEKLGPARRAGTQAPEVKARGPSAPHAVLARRWAPPGTDQCTRRIALGKARALIESRISSAVPTLNKFTPGHGYLIF